MHVRLSDYPQLQFLAWNRQKDDFIEEGEAFGLYENNWRWVDEPGLLPHERQFIERLTQVFGKGIMNV